jgi:phosphatidylglycerophosphate synthase
MPIWLAPNLITMLGLVINVVTSTVLILYSPNARSTDDAGGSGTPPAWSVAMCGLGLFVYQSLDAIDGKQARRTHSSTPLGELFDHGCDAVSTVFVTIAMCITLQLGSYPWLMFTAVFLGMSAFYIAHWQTYVTGSLKFGKIDVTEAQLAICAMHLVTAVSGDSLWSLSIPLLDIPCRFLPVVAGCAGSAKAIAENIRIISGGGKGKHGSTIADTSIVFPGFPLFLFLFLAFSIASKSPDVFLENTCLYSLTFGIVWAKFTNKLIVAHMTKGEIMLFDTCLIGPMILFVNQYFSFFFPEYIVLVFSLIIATFDFIKYSSKVCFQICTFMDIALFKIKPENYNRAAAQ